VIQLVKVEAGLKSIIESHVVDGLVYGLLYHEGCHCRESRNAASKVECEGWQIVKREHFGNHPEGNSVIDLQRIPGEQ